MTGRQHCVEFVETMGVHGLPRIAGRIFGHLVLQAEPTSLAALGERSNLPAVVRRRLDRFELMHHRIVEARDGVLARLRDQSAQAPSSTATSST